MGSPDKRGYIYNLRRNYRYESDVNSGFSKGWWEKTRDNLKENSIAWITTGVLGILFTLLGAYVTGYFN